MCNVFCKEFRGWCKSFTKTEIVLSAVQAAVLIIFFAFLTFLISHLTACSKIKQKHESEDHIIAELEGTTTEKFITIEDINANKKDYALTSDTDKLTTSSGIFTKHVTNHNKIIARPSVTGRGDIAQIETYTESTVANTLKNRSTCTWRPSHKTEAVTHYYETTPTSIAHTNALDKSTIAIEQSKKADQAELEDYSLLEDATDDEDTYDNRKGVLIALVKIRPPRHLTFECTLTIVSEYWALTAASCIEAIEQVDSLDSLAMKQNYGDKNQNSIHPVSDVIVHPQFRGANLTYDLAALKSEDNLVEKDNLVVTLPSMMDYFLITIGESLTVLGYGTFRGVERGGESAARAVRVRSVPRAQCDAGWMPQRPFAGRGAAPICAGVLRLRTSPCNYCAGTPLFKEHLLLGIMSDNRHCGLACEPTLFVNLALVRDWLNSVLQSD